ncbi:hypothetical protein [Chitinophaga sp.]|uniref:hypothetical protein n=1 Tax=Chitinophaga sp. TaxID=1869181 RepID=UPI0031D59804
MTAYQTYRIFESREEAVAMQALLSKNGIPNSMDERQATYDTVFVGVLNNQQYFVKIPQDKFLAANAVLEAAVDLNTLEVEDDYYLLSFTDQELLDLVKKKDEWGEFDYALAKKLLAERGISLNTSDLKVMEEERVQELKVMKKAGLALIIGGYLMAFIHTFAAFAIGLYLVTAFRRMPDGTTVPKYNTRARFHGDIIAILSVGLFASYFAYQILHDMPASPARTLFMGFVYIFF